MATKRMLPHSVHLFNFVCEENGVASFQETIIRHCYCPDTLGVPSGGHNSKESSDSTKLYVFDSASEITDTNGSQRAYIPYDRWKDLPAEDRAMYWTLNNSGRDYYVKSGTEDIRFKVGHFRHLTAGTRRMWHFEVWGK